MQTSASTSDEKLTSIKYVPFTVTWVSFSLSKNQIVATFADNSFWGLSTTPNQLTLDAGLSSSTMKVLFLFLTTVGALNDTQECSNVSAFVDFCFVHLQSVNFRVTALNLHSDDVSNV